MKRRECIALIGGMTVTGALPLAARAQQATMPVIGFLRNRDAVSSQELVAAFRRGLGESGYVEGQNVRIEFRWADNHDDRLPALAADLVKSDVAVIASPTAAPAPRAATWPLSLQSL